MTVHPLLELAALDARLRSYDTLLLLAVVVSFALAILMARRRGLAVRDVVLALVVLGTAMFVGMKVHYILAHHGLLELRNDWPDLVWRSGVHAPGGFLLMISATPFVLRFMHLPLGKLADALVPVVGVGMALARVGCLLAGCCFGKPSSLPWAVPFPPGSHVFQHQLARDLIEPTASASLPVHPTQAYFALEGLVLAAAAIALQRHNRYDGWLALWALAFYSLARLVLEPFRASPSGDAVLGLPQLQAVGVAMTILVAVALLLAEAVHRMRRPPAREE